MIRPAYYLTPREARVAFLIGKGRTNREIGEHLGIAAVTAKTHVANLFARFGVHSRVQFVREVLLGPPALV